MLKDPKKDQLGRLRAEHSGMFWKVIWANKEVHPRGHGTWLGVGGWVMLKHKAAVAGVNTLVSGCRRQGEGSRR